MMEQAELEKTRNRFSDVKFSYDQVPKSFGFRLYFVHPEFLTYLDILEYLLFLNKHHHSKNPKLLNLSMMIVYGNLVRVKQTKAKSWMIWPPINFSIGHVKRGTMLCYHS